MSKKLIAVASAAALALSALVALPAHANITLTVTDNATAAGTATDPYTHTSLSEGNEVVFVTTQTAVRYVVTVDNVGDSVAVTSSGGVKLTSKLSTASAPVTSASGTTTLTATAPSTTATFYAFTTSTTAGSVTISYDGNTTKSYVRSEVGLAHSISAVVPASVSVGSTSTYAVVKVTDVFGNPIVGGTSPNETEAGFTLGTDITISDSGSITAGPLSWNATAKGYRSLLSATAGSGGVGFQLVDNSGSISSDFADVKLSAFGVVNGADLAAQVTALTAQVAALTADYNALAVKFNKRVKKAKNKVALK